jgi:hypothetical protein
LKACSGAEEEQISIRATAPPDWRQESWETAKEEGVDRLTVEEIDAEIVAAARRDRRERQQLTGQ